MLFQNGESGLKQHTERGSHVLALKLLGMILSKEKSEKQIAWLCFATVTKQTLQHAQELISEEVHA